MQILWRPEIGVCSQCHCDCDVRMFTSNGAKTYFCKHCWDDFILECNAKSGSGEYQIIHSWDSDTDLILVPEYELNKIIGWS
jgi:hypothetical protein